MVTRSEWFECCRQINRYPVIWLGGKAISIVNRSLQKSEGASRLLGQQSTSELRQFLWMIQDCSPNRPCGCIPQSSILRRIDCCRLVPLFGFLQFRAPSLNPRTPSKGNNRGSSVSFPCG